MPPATASPIVTGMADEEQVECPDCAAEYGTTADCEECNEFGKANASRRKQALAGKRLVDRPGFWPRHKSTLRPVAMNLCDVARDVGMAEAKHQRLGKKHRSAIRGLHALVTTLLDDDTDEDD